jgi:hypothetical protein
VLQLKPETTANGLSIPFQLADNSYFSRRIAKQS